MNTCDRCRSETSNQPTFCCEEPPYCVCMGGTVDGTLCDRCIKDLYPIKPQVELDGEITLYESSLGWLPFKK